MEVRRIVSNQGIRLTIGRPLCLLLVCVMGHAASCGSRSACFPRLHPPRNYILSSDGIWPETISVPACSTRGTTVVGLAPACFTPWSRGSPLASVLTRATIEVAIFDHFGFRMTGPHDPNSSECKLLTCNTWYLGCLFWCTLSRECAHWVELAVYSKSVIYGGMKLL